MRTFSKFLRENLNALLFAGGFVTLYVGIAGWSQPAANITAGVVCMAIAAFPYLRSRNS